MEDWNTHSSNVQGPWVEGGGRTYTPETQIPEPVKTRHQERREGNLRFNRQNILITHRITATVAQKFSGRVCDHYG